MSRIRINFTRTIIDIHTVDVLRKMTKKQLQVGTMVVTIQEAVWSPGGAILDMEATWGQSLETTKVIQIQIQNCKNTRYQRAALCLGVILVNEATPGQSFFTTEDKGKYLNSFAEIENLLKKRKGVNCKVVAIYKCMCLCQQKLLIFQLLGKQSSFLLKCSQESSCLSPGSNSQHSPL